MLSVPRAGRSAALAVLAIVSLGSTAGAATTSPDSALVTTGPLTLERALALSTGHALTVRASGLRSEAARARLTDAGLRPNPTLGASEENFAGALGPDHREETVTIAQLIEAGGDRKARRAVAQAQLDRATADAALLGREVLAATADRFITALELQLRLAKLREGEGVAQRAIAAASERHAAGASPRTEVMRAESQALAQTVERLRAAADLAAARRALALQWGESEARFDSLLVPGERAGAGEPRSAEPGPVHPDLARAAADEALASARLQAAAAARVPDPTLAVGVRRLEEFGGSGFLVGIEWPLTLWNRGTGEITAARRELEAATLERRATERRLAAAIAAAAERVQFAASALDTLRLRVVPARGQLVEELLRAYRSGRTSYLDLVAEQRNLLEAELALVEARAGSWRAQAQLAILTGRGSLVPMEAR